MFAGVEVFVMVEVRIPFFMYTMLLQSVIYHIPKQWNPQNESNLTLTATANSIPHHQIWWQQPNADKKKVPVLAQDQTMLTQPTAHHFKH